MKPMRFVEFVDRVCGVALSPAQRALALVAFDGAEPGALEGDEREAAHALFGAGVEEVPAACRHVVSIVAGRAASKSYLGALWLLHRALTADVSSLAPGQVAVALVVAPRMRLAREVVRYARGAALSIPRLRLAEDGADGFIIGREGGRAIAVEALPASQGGTAVRGRAIVGAVLDESAFFFGEDHAVNDRDIFAAIAPRVTPDGQIVVASSPWVESGLLYDLHSQNFGHPTTGLAAWAPTTLLRPDATTRAMVERERLRDPDNAAREFDAAFLSGGAGLFFDPAAINAASVDTIALPQPPRADAAYFAGADFAFTSDASAIVIVEAYEGRFRVVAADEMRPAKGKPLRPSDVVARFAAVAREYGVRDVWTDAHYVEAVREYLEESRLELVLGPGGQEGKARTYIETRRLLNEGLLSLPADHRLTRQLREVIGRPMQGGGLQITSPRKAGGGHGDIASAAVLALWAAATAEAVPSPTYPPPHLWDFETQASFGFE